MQTVVDPVKFLNDLCDAIGVAKDSRVRRIELHISSGVGEAPLIKATVETLATESEAGKLTRIFGGLPVDVTEKPEGQ